jgi:hypothetical protein
MTDGRSGAAPPVARRGERWTSFVGDVIPGRRVRGLHEEGNPRHRLRVEHSRHTLLIHLSPEGEEGWTTVAIDRMTREWSVAQRRRQLDAASAAYENLYSPRKKRPSRSI